MERNPKNAPKRLQSRKNPQKSTKNKAINNDRAAIIITYIYVEQVSLVESGDVIGGS
jgi:hypothetical protein